MVARQGGTWSRLPGDAEKDYAMPSLASAEVHALWRQMKSSPTDPEFIARLSGGRVFGPGVVLSGDGSTLARDVSVDFGKPFQEHWLLGYQKIRPPVLIRGTTTVVATALGFGYAHWLLEELPRLLSVREMDFDHVIANGRMDFAREAMSRLGISAKWVEARRYSHFGSNDLIVPSLVGQPGYPTEKMARLLDGFTAAVGRTDGARGERLYVSREKARRRRVSNEAEVWQWLESRGFRKLCAEDLSWSEQIAAFRQAKVVVGAHGAGLANLVFCRPGTQVVEFFNRAYVNGCYWRLAALRGLDYRAVVAPGPEPLAIELAANRRDVTADMSQLAAAAAG